MKIQCPELADRIEELIKSMADESAPSQPERERIYTVRPVDEA